MCIGLPRDLPKCKISLVGSRWGPNVCISTSSLVTLRVLFCELHLATRTEAMVSASQEVGCNIQLALMAAGSSVAAEQYMGKCMLVPGEDPKNAQSCLHGVDAAMASASTWCLVGHSNTSRLLVWPQVFRRLTVGPETQSITFPGHPSVVMTFLGSKRIRIIYRTVR